MALAEINQLLAAANEARELIELFARRQLIIILLVEYSLLYVTNCLRYPVAEIGSKSCPKTPQTLTRFIYDNVISNICAVQSKLIRRCTESVADCSIN